MSGGSGGSGAGSRRSRESIYRQLAVYRVKSHDEAHLQHHLLHRSDRGRGRHNYRECHQSIQSILRPSSVHSPTVEAKGAALH